MQLTCCFDYVCPDSWRIDRLLRAAVDANPDLSVDYQPFSLSELNKPDGVDSVLVGDGGGHFSVLALALDLAARQRRYKIYHERLFDSLHSDADIPEEERRLSETQLLELARSAGVDVEAFNRERPRWIAMLRDAHHNARLRWGVRATPTLVFNDRAAVAVTLNEHAEIPHAPRADAIIRHLHATLFDFPELKILRRTAPNL